MRVILLAAAVMLMPMFVPPHIVPLPTNAPQIIVLNNDCIVATMDANALAPALGFARPALRCAPYPKGDLERAAPKQVTLPKNLIAYSAAVYSDYPGPGLSAPSFGTWFEVPSRVPFVASVGHVIAYLKFDAFIVLLQPYNMVNTALALQEAGIPRRDMLAFPQDGDLYVRVRPITTAHFLKIQEIAQQEQPDKDILPLRVGYIHDCDEPIASLSGLALAQAQDHAMVMAHAARTDIGNLLAVVDSGGGVTDGICGLGEDATMQQLVDKAKELNMPKGSASHMYATAVRSISAAWRLQLPPNPPTTPWRSSPDFQGSWWEKNNRTPFIADGTQLRADGFVLQHSVEPNRALITVPPWAYSTLLRSPFARNATYYDGELSLIPALEFQAQSRDELQHRVTAAVQYLSQLATENRKPLEGYLGFRYSRSDCNKAIDAALYGAVQYAVTHGNGKRIRYLQQYNLQTMGYVSCTYEPVAHEGSWNEHGVPENAASMAGVIAGY